MVDLESGQVLGYEALTRFNDGREPDAVFAEAAAAGLRMELEIATAEAALLAAGPLPANRFININVSPELILAREPLRSMLREWGFGVVLELTEHTPVADYGAVRDAIADIGEHIQLAVDDAGAGFASLRHILELRPSMVKLDRTLIDGVDADPARQALIAGMVHFAARLEFTLLAEGIETEAERTTLLELGVTRAQGFLFGRPTTAARLGRARHWIAIPESRGSPQVPRWTAGVTSSAGALAGSALDPRRGSGHRAAALCPVPATLDHEVRILQRGIDKGLSNRA